MRMLSPGIKTILIGFVLVTLGAVLPILIVMGVLESTFLLNFGSFAMSVAGLFLGILGAVQLTRGDRG